MLYFTMQFCDLFNKNSVILDSSAQSKTAVLLKLSQLLCQNHPELDANVLFDAFWKRECMGSTAIGHGIIIPHIRSESISKTCACLIKLQHPVEFGAEDKQPIDLVLGLVVPLHQTDQHLQLLRKVIIQFSNPIFRNACRNAKDTDALYNLLIQESFATTPDVETMVT